MGGDNESQIARRADSFVRVNLTMELADKAVRASAEDSPLLLEILGCTLAARFEGYDMNATGNQFFVTRMASNNSFTTLTGGGTKLLSFLLLLMLPAAMQAQYTYTTNKDTITITKYTGTDSVVIIPDTINGLPVASIETNAFFSYTGLTAVTIPDSVTSIGSGAFYYCFNLSNVMIGNSVTNMGRGVFANSYSLTSATLGSGVTRIESDAFFFCTRLASVAIPQSVTSIGNNAFESCTSLTNVTIGSSVSSIESYAFSYCTSLSGIYFRGDAPSGDTTAFSYDYVAIVYYLPGSTGWGATFGGRPTALWQPQVQTSDASFGVRTNQFGFNISWAEGMTVVVEAATNLAGPVWLPLQTNTLTADLSYFSDPEWANYPSRFYRLRWP